MLPGVAKTATSCLLHWSGLDRWQDLHPGARRLPTVIGYHRVVENFSYAMTSSIPSMLISRQMFEQHLDLLCSQYRLVSLGELEEGSGKEFDRPAAAITFDDGYRDVYYNAFPILKRKGIPAAVFVVTGLVDTDEVPIHDRVYGLLSQLFSDSPNAAWVLAAALREIGMSPARVSLLQSHAKDPYFATRALLVALPQRELRLLLAALEEKVQPFAGLASNYGAMSWDMLAEMQNAGFTIGSHTLTHPVLTNECGEHVYEELKESRAQLEAHLKKSIFHLAYPDGRFSSDTLQAAGAAGYRYAYTTCQHRDPLYPMLTIPRTVLWQNSWLDFRGNLSPSIMSCQLSGVFDLIAGCCQDHHTSAVQDRRDFEIRRAEQRQ